MKYNINIYLIAILLTVAPLSAPLKAISEPNSNPVVNEEPTQITNVASIADGLQKIDTKLAEEEKLLMEEINTQKETGPTLETSSNKDALDIAPQLPDEAAIKIAIENQQRDLNKVTSAKNALQSRVSSSEVRIRQLMTELQQTREELLLAETEVERLSRIIEARNIENVRKLRNPTAEARAVLTSHQNPQPTRVTGVSAPTPASRVVERPKEEQALPIATVLVDKANLRTGPGLNNSVLLTVSKGSRLVVEKRQGEWYRVIAPTGERAWLSGAVVNFGPNNLSSPTEMGRVKGFDSSIEIQ
jgi:hypothetical protein